MKRVDFNALKSRVSMMQLGERYGVQMRKSNGSWFSGNCPLPQHGTATKGSFKINVENDKWHCKATTCKEARNGKEGGDIINFVAWKEGIDGRESGIRIAEMFGHHDLITEGGGTSTAAPAPVVKKQVVEARAASETGAANPPLAFALRGVTFNDYLVNRGFDIEECEYLGLTDDEKRFFWAKKKASDAEPESIYGGVGGAAKGIMAGRIAFPLHNAAGQLTGYAGRLMDDSAITEKNPRWLYPVGFKRGCDLYNLHRVEGSHVIVVEGQWGVLACVRAGIFNAVAIMSNVITDEQVKLLSRFDRVTLMFDGDTRGVEGVLTSRRKLMNPYVEVVSIPFQPDGLPIDELRSVLGIGDEDWSGYSVVEASA